MAKETNTSSTVEAVVVDLDVPRSQVPRVATDEQIQLGCDLCPDAGLMVANGYQLIFRPSGTWEETIGDLVAIGEFLAGKTGLIYDRACHVRQDGSAANHKNHANRTGGKAARAGREVYLLAPQNQNQRICTTTEAVKMLGLVSKPATRQANQPAERDNKKHPAPSESYSASRLAASHSVGIDGSMAPQRSEWMRVLDLWCEGIYTHGRPREAVEQEIAGMRWDHNSGKGTLERLAKLAVYSGTGDGKRLTDEQWAAVCADLKTLTGRVGPTSKKRVKMQKTGTLRANRAWSLEFLYIYKHDPGLNMTLAEAIAGFWSWEDYKTIRELSMAALRSVEAVNEDLKRCWDRWSDAVQGDEDISKRQIAWIFEAARSFKNQFFTRKDIEVASGKSYRMVQRGLKELIAVGKVVQVGKGRSARYHAAGEIPVEQVAPPEPEHELIPLHKQFKKTEILPQPAVDENVFQRHLLDALEGNGHGHKRHGCPTQTIQNREKFEDLYREVWVHVSTKEFEFLGPSLRLYKFLATKTPNGLSIAEVYCAVQGSESLGDLIGTAEIPATEFSSSTDLFPRVWPDDARIVETAESVVIQDFGTLAVRAAAEFIEQVLSSEELAEIMKSLHREPWLRASRAALVGLHELGYRKLRDWFSDQLGEHVESLYLGQKPRRDGLPFAVEVGGKNVSVDATDTIWDEDRAYRQRRNRPLFAQKQEPAHC